MGGVVYTSKRLVKMTSVRNHLSEIRQQRGHSAVPSGQDRFVLPRSEQFGWSDDLAPDIARDLSDQFR